MEKVAIILQGNSQGIKYKVELETLADNLPDSPLEWTPEMLRLPSDDELVKGLKGELDKVMVKSRGISRFEGRLASVVELSLKGRTSVKDGISVEDIYVTYRTGEDTSASKWYSRKDFYDL